MTYEEFINSLKAGVQFYDDFRDNGLGVATPNGWTKLCGQTPTIVADAAAFGGKAVRLYNVGTVPTGLAFDALGGSADKYEILMRFRTDAEFTKSCAGSLTPLNTPVGSGVSSCEPDGPPAFGGPGGRMHFSGGILRGITGRGTNRSASCFANLFWSLGPCNNLYQPAGGSIQKQDWQILAAYADGSWTSPYNGTSGLFRSGKPKLLSDIVSCNGVPVQKTDCALDGQQGAGPGGPGNIVRYGLMRLRIGRGSGAGLLRDALQIKWWPDDQAEPLAWLTIEQDILAVLAPPPGGYVGILHVPHPNMFADFTPYTYVDFVSVSLDPDNFEAPRYVADQIASCPLPNGEVASAFAGTLDPAGLYQN